MVKHNQGKELMTAPPRGSSHLSLSRPAAVTDTARGPNDSSRAKSGLIESKASRSSSTWRTTCACEVPVALSKPTSGTYQHVQPVPSHKLDGRGATQRQCAHLHKSPRQRHTCVRRHGLPVLSPRSTCRTNVAVASSVSFPASSAAVASEGKSSVIHDPVHVSCPTNRVTGVSQHANVGLRAPRFVPSMEVLNGPLMLVKSIVVCRAA